MAGKIGAIKWHSIPKTTTLFKQLLSNPHNRNIISSSSKNLPKPFLQLSLNRKFIHSTMAENNSITTTTTTQTPEIKEPSFKLQKLESHENGNDSLSFFKVKKLSENAVLPSRGSPFSAGYDLSSAVETKVPARGKAMVATDLSIAVPQGTYARVAPRSGLTWKHSIDVGAGVIDADYRGPVGVILFNHSDVDFEVKVGDRIAQLIIERIITPDVLEVEDLDSTVRGASGFGSTGV